MYWLALVTFIAIIAGVILVMIGMALDPKKISTFAGIGGIIIFIIGVICALVLSWKTIFPSG